MLGRRETTRILRALHLDPATLGEDGDADSLLILRHTLMNPYLIDRENGISYIEGYFRFLTSLVRARRAVAGGTPGA